MEWLLALVTIVGWALAIGMIALMLFGPQEPPRD